ncbi:hypothetical protein JB92DRAFT_2855993, partial [Gautieria morchelliformis]
MMVGLTELTAEQLQCQTKQVVNELDDLYTRGIMIKTPRFPYVCDHLAAVKMGGFGDHGHSNQPYTHCQVTQAEIYSQESLCNGNQAYGYTSFQNPTAHDKFFKATGMQWSEFVRLPYFDTVRIMIIDPMHNLLISVIKNHWYAIWIQGSSLRLNTSKVKREFGLIHKHLNSMFFTQFEMTTFISRPAKQVEEPVGGSLSSDTYKGLRTIFVPVVIPLVWDAFLDTATKDYNVSLESFEKRMATWDCKHGTAYHSMLEAQTQVSQMEDPGNIQVNEASQVIEQPSNKSRKMHSQGKMKPNHYYVVQLPDQIKDYGLVYSFCLLTSFKSNNWGGGQLEVSMMCEWGRDVQLHQTVSGLFSLMLCWCYLKFTDVSCFQ